MYRIPQFLRALRAHTVWDPAKTPSDGAFKYRHIARVWLPLMDVVCILMGWVSVLYGSRILNAMFEGWVVDLAGATFTIASALALIGVSFPKLFALEIASKVVMVSLLGTYSVIIGVSFFAGEVQSGFVSLMLAIPILLPLMRLQILGEEIKQRRTEGQS